MDHECIEYVPTAGFAHTVMSFAPSSLVLRNRDLLDIVFDFFKSCERRELLWASLTSKAFLEPALNRLWRRMIDIWPLFRLLPTFNKDTCVSQGYGATGV